jgi:hypothetical protein
LLRSSRNYTCVCCEDTCILWLWRSRKLWSS